MQWESNQPDTSGRFDDENFFQEVEFTDDKKKSNKSIGCLYVIFILLSIISFGLGISAFIIGLYGEIRFAPQIGWLYMSITFLPVPTSCIAASLVLFFDMCHILFKKKTKGFIGFFTPHYRLIIMLTLILGIVACCVIVGMMIYVNKIIKNCHPNIPKDDISYDWCYGDHGTSRVIGAMNQFCHTEKNGEIPSEHLKECYKQLTTPGGGRSSFGLLLLLGCSSVFFTTVLECIAFFVRVMYPKNETQSLLGGIIDRGAKQKKGALAEAEFHMSDGFVFQPDFDDGISYNNVMVAPETGKLTDLGLNRSGKDRLVAPGLANLLLERSRVSPSGSPGFVVRRSSQLSTSSLRQSPKGRIAKGRNSVLSAGSALSSGTGKGKGRINSTASSTKGRRTSVRSSGSKLSVKRGTVGTKPNRRISNSSTTSGRSRASKLGRKGKVPKKAARPRAASALPPQKLTLGAGGKIAISAPNGGKITGTRSIGSKVSMASKPSPRTSKISKASSVLTKTKKTTTIGKIKGPSTASPSSSFNPLRRSLASHSTASSSVRAKAKPKVKAKAKVKSRVGPAGTPLKESEF